MDNVRWDGERHLYWTRSYLVRSWMRCLPCGSVAFPAPHCTAGMVRGGVGIPKHVPHAVMEQGLQGRVHEHVPAGPTQPLGQGRPTSLCDLSWLNCLHYGAKNWPKKRVKLLKIKKVMEDETKQRTKESTDLKRLRCQSHKFSISFLWSSNQVSSNAICRYRLVSFSLLLSNDAFVVQLQSPFCPGKWIMHPGASTTWAILLILKIKKK